MKKTLIAFLLIALFSVAAVCMISGYHTRELMLLMAGFILSFCFVSGLGLPARTAGMGFLQGLLPVAFIFFMMWTVCSAPKNQMIFPFKPEEVALIGIGGILAGLINCLQEPRHKAHVPNKQAKASDRHGTEEEIHSGVVHS